MSCFHTAHFLHFIVFALLGLSVLIFIIFAFVFQNDASFALTLFFCLLVDVEGCNVNILPVSQAVGARFLFHVHARTAMTALIALIAAHYGVAALRVLLIFGGQPIQGLHRVKDIPGFSEGHTLLLVVQDAAVGAIQAIQAPQAIWSDVAVAVARAAQQAHDINWGCIANYDIRNDPNVDPALPDHHERNCILTVALIVTENIPGVVNLNGLPGGQNFDANVILAIMHCHRMKGWPTL